MSSSLMIQKNFLISLINFLQNALARNDDKLTPDAAKAICINNYLRIHNL